MLKIAGVPVKAQTNIKISLFDIERSERVASGKLVVETIATKRQVDISWKMIPDSEYELILNTIMANKPFFTLEYPDVGGFKTMVCRAGNIVTSLWHTVGGIRRWEEVSISFIEQ